MLKHIYLVVIFVCLISSVNHEAYGTEQINMMLIEGVSNYKYDRSVEYDFSDCKVKYEQHNSEQSKYIINDGSSIDRCNFPGAYFKKIWQDRQYQSTTYNCTISDITNNPPFIMERHGDYCLDTIGFVLADTVTDFGQGTQKSDSYLTFKSVCPAGKKIRQYRIISPSLYIKVINDVGVYNKMLINDISPTKNQDNQTTWIIPSNDTCGDTITFIPRYIGLNYSARGEFSVVSAELCQNIEQFNSSSVIINPSSGDVIRFNASVGNLDWMLTMAGRTYNGKGIADITWDGKDASGNPVPNGIYTAILSVQTPDGACSDSKSIQITVQSCDIKLIDFHSNNTIINAFSGGNVELKATISGSPNPVKWTLNVLDQTFSGTGDSINQTWNGKYANGRVVEPGEYSVTLIAQTADGKCSDSKTISFTVTPAPEGQCDLYVDFGSSAQVSNGNLNHTQELFNSRSAVLPAGLTLYYNSLDPHNGSLGSGWSHNYDILLKQNPNGSVLVREGNWRYHYYSLSNGSYASREGDHSILKKNVDGTFILTDKDGQVRQFSGEGKLSSITDRNGNTLTLAYIGNILSSVIDPSGRSVSFAYDSANHLTSVTAQAGNNYLFSVSGDTLTSVTLPDGGAWRYTYDANGFMTAKTDPLGNATSYSYDEQHRVVSSTDPEGKIRSISYPQDGAVVRSTTFTEKDGGVWGYSYDTEKGYLLFKHDPQGGITSYTYDMAGNRLSTTEPDGSTTTYTYDATGNMTSITDALGQTTSYTYNQYSQVLSVTDAQGNVTGYGYDVNGNMISAMDSAGATTKYEYDVKGNVTRVISPLGQATCFTYDQSGNLISMTDAAGATTSFTYDAAGNMASKTDAGGSTLRFEYNVKNQLVKMVDSQGNDTIYTYDVNGNKISETDANGNITNYEYNYRGQLVKSKDALGNVTTYGYGGTGCTTCGGGTDKLVSITDANGNITTYEYDQLGRLVKETDTTGNAKSYSYDAKGNLASKTDGNGNTVTYTYDSLGRLLKRSYPDGTMELFTYDAKGNILTASNQHIAYAFAYDTNGRMLSVTDSDGRVIQYSYDLAGNKRSVTYPEGSVVSYAYDTAGRLSVITNGGGRTYSFSYDSLGRRSSLIFPNGVIASYSYDTIGRLTDLNHRTSSNGVIASFSYTHDKVGNRLTKTTTDVKYAYGYDAIYRLLQAMPTKLHGRHKEQEHKAESFSYDPVGNRLTGPKAQMTYTYGSGNVLFTSLNTTYGYDKNGNLTTLAASGKRDADNDERGHSRNRSYTYDYENRLIKAETRHEDETIVVSFKYDPFGRRIEKRVEEIEHGKAEESTSYTYVYDNEDIILEYFAKAEDRKVNTEVTKYVHGPGIDEPLSRQQKGEIYYYLADGLGSIVALADNRQKVVERYSYDSFGNLKRHGDKVKNAFTYTGREWDKETGLYYYRARYYDPIEGRFISKDPIGYKGGINVYVYVNSNPIVYKDPFGLDPYGGNRTDPAYLGVQGQNIGSFLGVLTNWLNFVNAINQTSAASRLIEQELSNVPCGHAVDVTVCFDPGPPPCDLTVDLASGAIITCRLKCKTFSLLGTQGCPFASH